jgi:hypothetical protein
MPDKDKPVGKNQVGDKDLKAVMYNPPPLPPIPHQAPARIAILHAEDSDGYIRPICTEHITGFCNIPMVRSYRYSWMTPPTNHYSNQTLPGGGSVTADVDLAQYYMVAVVVDVTYSASATAGIRVRMLYSDNTYDYDSPEEADNLGRYYDLTFAPGARRRATITFPALALWGRVMISNLDPVNAHTLNSVDTYLIT